MCATHAMLPVTSTKTMHKRAVIYFRMVKSLKLQGHVLSVTCARSETTSHLVGSPSVVACTRLSAWSATQLNRLIKVVSDEDSSANDFTHHHKIIGVHDRRSFDGGHREYLHRLRKLTC